MKFFTTGLVSTIALLVLTALVHRLAHIGTPTKIRLSFRRAIGRVFRLGAAPELRDLKVGGTDYSILPFSLYPPPSPFLWCM